MSELGRCTCGGELIDGGSVGVYCDRGWECIEIIPLILKQQELLVCENCGNKIELEWSFCARCAEPAPWLPPVPEDLAAPQLSFQLESYRVTTEKLLGRAIPVYEGPLEFVLCLMREIVSLRVKNAEMRRRLDWLDSTL